MTTRFTLPLKLALLGLVPLSAISGLATWRVLDDFAEADALAAQADEVRRVDQVGQIIKNVDGEIQTLGALGASEADLEAQRNRLDDSLDGLLADPTGADEGSLDRVETFRDRLVELRSTLPASPTAYRLSGAASARLAFGLDTDAAEAMSPEARAIFEATVEFDEFADAMRADTRFEDRLFRDGAIAADAATLQLFDRLVERLDTERQIYVEMAMLPASARSAEMLEGGRSVGQASEFWTGAVSEIGADDMLQEFAELGSSEAAQRVGDTRALMAALVPGQPLSVGAAEIEDDFGTLDREIGELRAQLSSETIAQVDSIRSTAVRSAYITMALAALFVGVAALLIYMLYLSIRRPLRRVTQRSIEVATVELPAAVAMLRDDADADPPEIAPIEVESRDEIGQMVEAFNTMSATSLQLAGEQAIARRSVGDMFMNLGRRNQKLLNRLLRNLDSLQRDEREPEALQALYEIDHLTTRMRRNAESLLILAGAHQTRRFDSPVTAGDIIRGAMSEVEHYERVEIVGDTGQRIRGELVADLTHLLAELIENGLAFSPPETAVQVTARMTHRGYMFAISDDGVGMTAEKIEEANTRIALAATQEETPSKFLGLFVVGRLAARRNIDVRMFDSPTGGVAVRLAIPDDALYVDADVSVLPDDVSIPDAIEGRVEAPDSLSDMAPVRAPSPPAMPAPSGGPLPPMPVPPISVPSISLPSISLPSISLPSISVPSISLDDIAAERRPAVRTALESIEHIAASTPRTDVHRDALLGDPAQPLTAPASSPVPAPAAAEAATFGGVTRRPGANLPRTVLTSPDPSPEPDPSPQPERTPDVVRHSLSGFQSGTSRADGRGGER